MNNEILEPSNDGRMWATLCHLSGFLGSIFPFGNIIGPLVLWMMKKNEYPLVNVEGKESLNCQLSYTLYTIIWGLVGLLSFTGFVFSSGSHPSKGFYPVLITYAILGFAMLVTYIISIIVAAIKTSNGKTFRYPLIIRFIK